MSTSISDAQIGVREERKKWRRTSQEQHLQRRVCHQRDGQVQDSFITDGAI